MKIHIVNTNNGFMLASDEDYESKRKLKIGSVYFVDIKLARNYQFHKLYFSLINCAWEFQNEKRQKHFKNNVEIFRKYVEVSAGHCDMFFSPKLKEWVEIPASISFASLDETAFKDLYERVKNVLFEVFLNHVTAEEFEQSLINY